jgi:hypothetical protein
MAGITVDDLLDFGPLQEDSAASWARFLAGVEQNASFLQTNVKEPMGQAWTGTAAQLATRQVGGSHDGLIATAGQLSKIHAALESFNTTMKGYAEQMKSAVSSAAGMVISPDGHVSYRIDGPYTQQALNKLTSVQNDIQGILAKANNLDDSVARQLMQYMPGPADLASATATTGRWTTVSKDGSLWQIAQHEYGDGNKWRLIYEANKGAIGHNPNLIYAGMKLKIPPLAGSPGTPSGAKAGDVSGPATPAPAGRSSTTSPHTPSPPPPSTSSSGSAIPLGPGEI